LVKKRWGPISKRRVAADLGPGQAADPVVPVNNDNIRDPVFNQFEAVPRPAGPAAKDASIRRTAFAFSLKHFP